MDRLKCTAIILAAAVVGGCGKPAAPPAKETALPAKQNTAPTADRVMPEPAMESSIIKAVADPTRPEEDRARDADRKPVQVLEFYGVAPGMQVLELIAGGGYYTEILSRVVGDKGHVYSTRLRNPEGRPPNVTAVGDDWGLEPDSVDLVFTALNWHDLYNIEGYDRSALLARVMQVLKPGGELAVIDHLTEIGSGTRDTQTLHRIDKTTVVDEITGARFELEDESDVLRHLEDDHTKKVFDPSIRGKTDRFILKFIKPDA